MRTLICAGIILFSLLIGCEKVTTESTDSGVVEAATVSTADAAVDAPIMSVVPTASASASVADEPIAQ